MEVNTTVCFVVQRRMRESDRHPHLSDHLKAWHDVYKESVQSIAEDNVRIHNAEESGEGSEYRAIREVCICIREDIRELPAKPVEGSPA
jgi:hypothetical protein